MLPSQILKENGKNMINKKLKIAITIVTHKREPSNFSLGLLKEGLKLFESQDVEIYFHGKALNRAKDIREELIDFKKRDPDLFIIIPGNWIEPPVLCHPLEEIRNENIY